MHAPPPPVARSIETDGRGQDSLLRVSTSITAGASSGPVSETCSQSSLVMTKEWDFAGPTREGTILSLIRAKTPDEIKAHEAQLAAKEAERKAKAAEAAQKAAAAKAAAEAEAKAKENLN